MISFVPFTVTRFWRRFRGEMMTKNLVPEQFSHNIGAYSYGAPTIFAWNEGTNIVIGNFCSIADGVIFLLGGNHRVDWVSTYPFSVFSSRWTQARTIKGHPASKGDIVIGNDVWIGYGATILSGVTIGDGAVVGARAVVAKDVPPYGIVVGSPAHLVKYRFSQEQRDELLKIQWWSWPRSKVAKNIELICSSNIETFLKKHSRKK